MRTRVFATRSKWVKSLKSTGNCNTFVEGASRGEKGVRQCRRTNSNFLLAMCQPEHMYFIKENVHCQLFSKKLQLVIIYQRRAGI